MAEIIFKATRRSANSCPKYRQIEKRGHLQYDQASMSDDVIILYPDQLEGNVIIDCDKKTGEFHLKFSIVNEI